MQRFLLVLLILGLFRPVSAAAFNLPAPLRGEAESLIAAAQKSDQGYAIIESLTTEIGPRLAGSPQEARARDWAVAKLEELGFTQVRVEPFQVEGWERHRETAAIVSPFPQPLVVTALGHSRGTPPEGVTGEVVRFSSLDALKAYSSESDALAGKIVFVDEPMTRTQDGSGYGVAVAKRGQSAVEGRKRGAIAALIRSVGTQHHRMPHTGSMGYGEAAQSLPSAALSAPDADQLARALQHGPVTVRLTLETGLIGPSPSGNVIADIPGTDLADEIVLIGAHLDSWDLGTGAIDDGAGVGIVTAAARLIMDQGKAPRRTIRVVLFGSEEVGLRGARAYAEAHAAELPKHFAAAESDFGADVIWRLDSGVPETKLPLVDAVHAVLKPLGISRGGNETTGGPDIGPMAAGGAHAFELQQDGWDYFDLHHTPDDTLDKVDPVKVRQNVATYAAFAWLMANVDDVTNP